MRFRLVRLTIALNRACHVEVAQAGVFQPMAEIHPSKHVFDEQLAFSVRIRGLEFRVFENRGGLRFAVDCGRRTEDEPIVPGCKHRFQQRRA